MRRPLFTLGGEEARGDAFPRGVQDLHLAGPITMATVDTHDTRTMTRRTLSERKPRFTKDERETSCRRYLKVWRNGHEALDRGVTGGIAPLSGGNRNQI